MNDSVQRVYLDDINRLKEKIQEIYYLEQFHDATQFEQKLNEIKQKLIDLKSNSIGMDTSQVLLIKEMVKLEHEIDVYMEEVVPKIRIDFYRDKVYKLVGNIDKSSIGEILEKLKAIFNEWENLSNSAIERQMIIELVADVSLKLLEAKAKNGENVEIDEVSEICPAENLIVAIKEKLIKMAQWQEKADRKRILDMAKNLTKENIKNPELWQFLTGVRNVVPGEKKQTGESRDVDNYSTELTVMQPKLTLFQSIKQALGIEIGSTVYTFEAIGKSKKDIRLGKFPIYLTEKQRNRLIGIEINDVEKVDDDFFQKFLFPNLEKIKFGRGVKVIGDFLFGCGTRAIREIIIGEDVEMIGRNAFGETPNLKKVYIPNNVKYIGDIGDQLYEMDIATELECKKNEYKKYLSSHRFRNIEEVFLILEERRKKVRSHDQSINENMEDLDDKTREILQLMLSYEQYIKEVFLRRGEYITHITDVSPENMKDGKILKSIGRANNYETEMGDWVFASSTPINGKNPYIARNSKNGMIRINKKTYVYGGDNIQVQRDNKGNSRVVLKVPNYVYKISPKKFRPVVTLLKDENGKPYFDFSEEWISDEEVDINDSDQVLGVEKITDITELLKNYQILCDINNSGEGMKIRNSSSKEEMIKKIIQGIQNGKLRYINGEAGINAVEIPGYGQIRSTMNTLCHEKKTECRLDDIELEL